MAIRATTSSSCSRASSRSRRDTTACARPERSSCSSTAPPFGPLVAGPDGVTFLETYTGDVTPVPVDKEGYQRLLEERGIVRLPNPEFDRPDERARQRPRRRRPLVLTVSASEAPLCDPLTDAKTGNEEGDEAVEVGVEASGGRAVDVERLAGRIGDLVLRLTRHPRIVSERARRESPTPAAARRRGGDPPPCPAGPAHRRGTRARRRRARSWRRSTRAGASSRARGRRRRAAPPTRLGCGARPGRGRALASRRAARRSRTRSTAACPPSAHARPTASASSFARSSASVIGERHVLPVHTTRISIGRMSIAAECTVRQCPDRSKASA